MSRSESQLRIFETLWDELRPHITTDRNLPARIQQRLAKEKRFGSRDRRLYRELLYTALRYFPWLESRTGCQPVFETEADFSPAHIVLWLSAETPGTTPLKRDLLASTPPCPATIAERAALLSQSAVPLLPEWFRTHCPEAFVSPTIDALHTRAPLWLRLQTDDTDPIFAEFTARGWTWRESGVLPGAIELLAANDPDLTQTDSYQRGLIEIQDLGSQLILPTALKNIDMPSRWLDACAGAGGKTLQLARLLAANSGAQIDAADPRPAALTELSARAARAGLKNVRVTQTASLLQGEQAGSLRYDGVLVDAPCSGTGTWRRSPHLKSCTTEASIVAAAARQNEILTRHATLVRANGGVLIYATCSLSRIENEDVVKAFLAQPAHKDFSLVSHTTILPATHNTDGYFTATFRRE